MKKFITAYLMLSALFILPSFADEISVPQWSEFCPAQYQNASSAAFNTNRNYWHNRKTQFDNAMNDCKTKTGDEQNFCYSLIREQENLKNEILKERQARELPALRNSTQQSSDIQFGTVKIMTE